MEVFNDRIKESIETVFRNQLAGKYSQPTRVDNRGSQLWYKDGKQHRDEKDPYMLARGISLTLPAFISDDGKIQVWYKNGREHRDDKDPETGLVLPAELGGGKQVWYKDGKQHRDDKDPVTGLTLPAIIWNDGTQMWYKNGFNHRDDKDPVTGLTLPAVIYKDGTRAWWVNGRKIPAPRIRTPKALKKFENKDECWNSDHTTITYDDWDDPKIDKDNDILMLPGEKDKETDQEKYWCFTRFEIELWWKGQPRRIHPVLTRELNEDEKERIIQFMNDEDFFYA